MLPRSSVDREPGLIGLLLPLCEDYPVATWVLRQFPANAVRQFQLAFCLWIALALIRNLRAHTKFLTWFDGSGLQLARKRGLGAHPSKLYGLFSPPTLTGPQFFVCGLMLIGCLLASCAPLLPRVFLFLSYLLSLCYFPQLFAEVSCSGHSTILIPSILFILACSSSLDHDIQSTSEWPLVLIRIYITSGYFSSGACKLLCGLRFNRYWGKGPTLQMYIFDSMWSRPASAPVRKLQQTMLTMPWLLTLLATGSVAFETGFILAPTSDLLCLIFGLSGFLFHFSIALLQASAPSPGLDFATFWTPALLSFLIGVPTREPWTAVFRGWEEEAGFFLPAVVYTLLQVLTALTLRDFWLEDILPFSCCPMFMLPRNPFDEWPKWWTMTDAPLSGSTRTTGSMEPLYWSPASPIFEMTPSEARKLPQKVVWFGCTRNAPKEVLGFIKPECRDLPFLIQSNFDVPPSLRSKIEECVQFCNDAQPSDAWDASKMCRLLDLQEDCLAAFDACVAEERKKEGASKRR